LPAGYYIIDKLFAEKIEKNPKSKLKNLLSRCFNVSCYAAVASVILSLGSVVVEIGEKVFAG